MIRTFYILSRLASSYASTMVINDHIAKSFRQTTLRALKKQAGYEMQPPLLSKDGITINGKFYPTGTIIVRPLKAKWITDVFKENHYGIVFGTGLDGKTRYILENTDTRDVNYADIPKFLTEKYSESDISIYIEPKRTKYTPTLLSAKATRYHNDFYSLANFNCKDFVMSIILDIEPVRRSDIANEIILECNKICLELDKLGYLKETDPRKKERHLRNIKEIESQSKTIKSNIKVFKLQEITKKN